MAELIMYALLLVLWGGAWFVGYGFKALAAKDDSWYKGMGIGLAIVLLVTGLYTWLPGKLGCAFSIFGAEFGSVFMENLWLLLAVTGASILINALSGVLKAKKAGNDKKGFGLMALGGLAILVLGCVLMSA